MLLLLVLSSFAGTDLLLGSVAANSDQDGDGLSYGLEYLIGTQPNDWDSDNDNLPDGWEWLHGLDPTSSAGPDGALGDPDGDGFTNLQEYSYGAPAAWDNAGTTTLLDNGVWWNGTVPVRLWNEEDAMQYAQPGCGDAGSDGSGSIILCDEDPVGNICTAGSTTTEMVRSTVLIRIMMLIVRATTMMGMGSRTGTSTVGTPMVTGCLTGGKRPRSRPNECLQYGWGQRRPRWGRADQPLRIRQSLMDDHLQRSALLETRATNGCDDRDDDAVQPIVLATGGTRGMRHTHRRSGWGHKHQPERRRHRWRWFE